MKIMEKIGELFEDYRIIVYENNSTDRTAKLLEEWRERNPKVTYKSEILTQEEINKITINLRNGVTPFHVDFLARARNIVLDMAMSEEYADYPYLLWMDMDFIIEPAYEGIIEVFETDREWDAVFANGRSPREFWDWYAFRSAKYPIGSEVLGDTWWYMPKYLELSKEEDWYSVTSAFGGFGIYKKESIRGCRYSSIITEDLEKVVKSIVNADSNSQHPHIRKYHKKNKHLIKVEKLLPNTPRKVDCRKKHIGFILSDASQDPIIWRMNSFTYRYPSVCEHVPFHASMIVRGKDKLFINPRMLFTYGDSPCAK